VVEQGSQVVLQLVVAVFLSVVLRHVVAAFTCHEDDVVVKRLRSRAVEGVVIRPEREADHPAIAAVVRGAFVRHPDEVALFVERLRASEQFIPELALVAEDSSGVIAHVMLSWVGLEGGSRSRILNLTPMSVRPDRQRMGVGTRLIWDALGRAEDAGEPAVMVEGIPGYYPRFGFEQATTLGFVPPSESIPPAAFMMKRLPGYSPELAGRIVYTSAFDVLTAP
jgi:putative acetyltransferase